MSTENIESQEVRAVAEWMPNSFTVSLPALSPEKWLDGTVENAKKDVKFVDVNLADLLGFIADMAE